MLETYQGRAQCGCSQTLGVGGHALGGGEGARADAAAVQALMKHLHGIILCKKGLGNGDRGFMDSGVTGT